VVTFARAAHGYWFEVFPTVGCEIMRLRAEARRIPDPTLRRLALRAQTGKWASLEGAAAFATFAPAVRRPEVARLLIRFQAVYDYVDTLMEHQQSANPAANAAQLHAALLQILEPEYSHPDYYRHCVDGQDGGYLMQLVDACRERVRALPAYPLLAERILKNTERIVCYQSHLNLATEADHPGLARWARKVAPQHAMLQWWEIWAACGSSLATLALLAAAADPMMDEARAQTIEAVYWPWAGALHTLLDGLIDRAEDAVTGQHNLMNHYRSPAEAAERLGLIAAQAGRAATVAGIEHTLILSGMASLYVSDQAAWTLVARPVAESVLAAIGDFVTPAMMILRARRLIHRAACSGDYPILDTY
jgi:tetraprenyl-beta-curcumene synthase